MADPLTHRELLLLLGGFGAGFNMAVNQIEAGEGAWPDEVQDALKAMAVTYGVTEPEFEAWLKEWDTMAEDIFVRVIPPVGPEQ